MITDNMPKAVIVTALLISSAQYNPSVFCGAVSIAIKLKSKTYDKRIFSNSTAFKRGENW
jgi:hypothetical protein